MIHLPELAYKYKTIFFSLMAAILIMGVFSFIKIGKLEDPEVPILQAMVVTIYPGASAEEVEKHVTNIIENEIRTIPNVTDITSRSVANVSQITVSLDFSVPEDEVIQYWDVLRKKINDISKSLPTTAQQPIVVDDFSDVYGMMYAVTGEDFSYGEIKQYINNIKTELLEVKGVKRINIFGDQPYNVNIELSSKKMSQLGIYPAQIVMAINATSQIVYAGSYQYDDNTIRLSVNGKLSSIEDIENLLINGFENDQFHLKDIANIKIEPQQPARFKALYNGKPTILFGISMNSDVNVLDVGKEVEKKLSEIKKDIPLGIDINKVFFQPDKVIRAIKQFMRDLILAVLIVIAVLMLAMNFKSGLIVCGSLIIIVSAVFPILMSLGGTLQRISLGALIISLGMLVDDSIVVVDSILIALQQKKPLKQALFQAPKKTAMPLLIGTAITIICFLPVYLSKDTAAVYIGDLFLVVCIALATSWIISLTQVPIFATYIFNLKEYRNKKEEPFTGKIFNISRRILNKALEHKTIAIICTIVLMGLTFWSFSFVKQTFLPDFFYNQAYIEYTLPQNISIDKVISDMEQITDDLMKIDGVTNVTASQGMTPMRYCLARAVSQGGDNYAEFIVDFDDYKTMIKLRNKIEKYLYDNHPDAYSRFRVYNLSIMTSHNVEVEFAGKDLNVLHNLERQAEDIMRKCDMVNPYSISSDTEGPSKVLIADFFPVSATKSNTMRTDISNTLLAATDGIPIGAIIDKDGERLPINLKIRNSDGSIIKDLNNLPVWNLVPNIGAVQNEDLQSVVAGGDDMSSIQKKIISPTSMNQITKGINLEWEASAINHTNFKRTIQAQCDASSSSSPEDVLKAIKNEIESIHLPEGYSLTWKGEKYLMDVALENIINMLPLTSILIIFMLLLLFNNWKKTMIVILCIPVAFIGIVPTMLLFSQPYSFVAIIGTIGLAGMLIRNSVVLIDEIDIQRESGKTPYNALIDATISRMRAVAMTSSATMLGVIPLLTDPMFSALSVVIISGLLIGTVITLILLPILYAMFFNIKKSDNQNTTYIK